MGENVPPGDAPIRAVGRWSVEYRHCATEWRKMFLGNRRRVALLNTMSSFQSEVGNQRFNVDGEMGGLAIVVECDLGEFLGEIWFIRVLLSSFGVGVFFPDTFNFSA